MSKFHINPETGNPGICKAKTACPFGGDEEHYETKEEARVAFENSQSNFKTSSNNIPEDSFTYNELLKSSILAKDYMTALANDPNSFIRESNKSKVLELNNLADRLVADQASLTRKDLATLKQAALAMKRHYENHPNSFVRGVNAKKAEGYLEYIKIYDSILDNLKK